MIDVSITFDNVHNTISKKILVKKNFFCARLTRTRFLVLVVENPRANCYINKCKIRERVLGRRGSQQSWKDRSETSPNLI